MAPLGVTASGGVFYSGFTRGVGSMARPAQLRVNLRVALSWTHFGHEGILDIIHSPDRTASQFAEGDRPLTVYRLEPA